MGSSFGFDPLSVRSLPRQRQHPSPPSPHFSIRQRQQDVRRLKVTGLGGAPLRITSPTNEDSNGRYKETKRRRQRQNQPHRRQPSERVSKATNEESNDSRAATPLVIIIITRRRVDLSPVMNDKNSVDSPRRTIPIQR